MAEDLTTPEGLINARLERDLETAERERDTLRQMVGRPITIAPQDGEAMKEFKLHLPKIGQLSENLAVVAGELKQMKGNQSTLSSYMHDQNKLLGRIADALDRLAPKEEE